MAAFTNLPADLPENWTANQIISPNGTEAGLSEQHGYNYQSKQINNTQKAVNALVKETAQKTPSAGRKLYLKVRATDWTAPTCLFGTLAEEGQQDEEFHYGPPYNTGWTLKGQGFFAGYNPEGFLPGTYLEDEDLWVWDIPKNAEVFFFRQFQASTRFNSDSLVLPIYPADVCNNIMIKQNTNGSFGNVFDYDTKTQKIIFQAPAGEQIQTYTATYGSYTGAPDNKVTVNMTPLGFISIDNSISQDRRMHYYVDIPEFDDQGRTIDDVIIECDATSYSSGYIQVSRSLQYAINSAAAGSVYGIPVIYPYTDEYTTYRIFTAESSGSLFDALTAEVGKLKYLRSTPTISDSTNASFNNREIASFLQGKSGAVTLPIYIKEEFFLQINNLGHQTNIIESGAFPGFFTNADGNLVETDALFVPILTNENYMAFPEYLRTAHVHGRYEAGFWKIEVSTEGVETHQHSQALISCIGPTFIGYLYYPHPLRNIGFAGHTEGFTYRLYGR
ncbi:MAG: hypothetical protein LBM65_07655 [Oscillospiraceae bacterium]|jgi:hypothetical protein|nr:hypothetical protein [Oscillospiraceae bacterium]